MSKVKMKRFIECILPSRVCNMDCEYCYVTQTGERSKNQIDLSECVNKIDKVFSVEKLGGQCMFNICARGETMLHPDIVTIIEKLTGMGHYVMVVTNGSVTKRIQQCCQLSDECRNKLFFKISLHYIELKKKNMLEKFVSNVHMAWDAGISFTIEITPDDSYIPYLDEIKEFCVSNFGALCHVTVARDERFKGNPFLSKLPREEFLAKWGEFNSDLFKFKYSIFEVKRNEFCYAGDWGMVVNLQTGDYYQCYKAKKLGNLYKDVNEPIKWQAVGCNCPEGHCYNGHAFLGFGLIPELDTPTFAVQRNRICANGKQWLGKDMEDFMCCKLIEANKEYSDSEKKVINRKSYNLPRRVYDFIRK